MSHPEDPPHDPPAAPEEQLPAADQRVDPTSWDFPLRSEQEAVEEASRVRSEAHALIERTGGAARRSHASGDPLAAARAALDAAARARGEEPDLASVSAARLATRRDPLAAAQEALDKAARARELAQAGGPRAAARQAEARSQLEVLRRRLGQLGQPSEPSLSDEDEEPSPTPSAGPRKRRL